MRLEYNFELSNVETPCFSVESVEGINKLFTLSALVLNVFSTRQRVELVFHGVNPEDPGRKLGSFKAILTSSPSVPQLQFDLGPHGRVPDSASYYQWVTIRKV
ncbi:MAG TPA: hypothetical protein VMW35_05685 [Myxococcota bacterium]|jgi:hypothetical protein|nr:hypothetical protein [Myxococcota bacterium]